MGMYFARLTHNSNLWHYPSGPSCKSNNLQYGFLFEATHGYGYEEWLRRDWSFQLIHAGKRWQFGYIQGIKNAEYDGIDIDESNDLVLFSQMYADHQGCENNYRRVLGYIPAGKWKVLTSQQYLDLLGNASIQRVIDRMKNEVKSAQRSFIDGVHGNAATVHANRLAHFDQWAGGIGDQGTGRLFNVIYEYCSKDIKWVKTMINGIPNIQNVHGMLQYLPNNFNLSKLDTGNEAEYKTFLDELFFVNKNTLSI